MSYLNKREQSELVSTRIETNRTDHYHAYFIQILHLSDFSYFLSHYMQRNRSLVIDIKFSKQL